MKKKKEQMVVITFKTVSKDGRAANQISIDKLKPRSAKRVYKKLLYRWKHYKVVDIPLFAIAVAADDIDNITILRRD